MRIKSLVLSMSLALSSALLPMLAQAKDDAWLMSHLPDGTETYIRVPNTWEILGLDKARQEMQASEEMRKMRSALTDLAIQDLPPETQGIVRALLSQIEGDVEIAVAGEQNVMSGEMAPKGFLSAMLNTSDVHAVMQNIVTSDKPVPLKIEAISDYEGVLKNHGQALAFYRLDPKDNRLMLFVDNSMQQADWSWVKQENDTLHTQLKSQGGDEGLFVWQKNLPMLAMMLSTQKPAFKTLGFSQLKSLSLSSQKKDTYDASLNLEMPEIGIRRLFPISNEVVDFKAGNEIEWAMTYNIPDAKNVNQVMEMFAKICDKENPYPDFKRKIYMNVGINLDEVIDTISGRYLVVADEYGTMTIVNKSRGEQIEALIQHLDAAGLVEKDEQLKHGIRHVRVRKFSEKMEKKGNNEETSEIIFRYFTQSIDFFLREEANAIMIAYLPQPLMARDEIVPTVNINKWFNDAGVRLDKTSFAYVKQEQHLSQKNYYSSLEYLKMFANLSEVDIDLSQLPTAKTRDLPVTGTLAFSIAGDKEHVNIHLSSPNNIIDWFCTSSGTDSTVAIATIGVLAAIAIPAYQDYLKRQEVQN